MRTKDHFERITNELRITIHFHIDNVAFHRIFIEIEKYRQQNCNQPIYFKKNHPFVSNIHGIFFIGYVNTKNWLFYSVLSSFTIVNIYSKPIEC